MDMNLDLALLETSSSGYRVFSVDQLFAAVPGRRYALTAPAARTLSAGVSGSAIQRGDETGSGSSVTLPVTQFAAGWWLRRTSASGRAAATSISAKRLTEMSSAPKTQSLQRAG